MKREKALLVRLNEDEKEIVRRAAKRVGTTEAGVLRRGGLEEARKILGEG